MIDPLSRVERELKAAEEFFELAMLTTDFAHGCHRARPFQFALRRKVPLSNAPIVKNASSPFMQA
jgi:hypothetical protein